MRDHRPKSASDLMGSSKLSSIQQHATELAQLNALLKPLLPKGTAPLVRVANLRQGFLMLEAASAAIKMKLDYERLAILSELRRQGFARLSGIEVTINPAIYRDDQATKDSDEKVKMREVSPFTAEILTAVASHASPKVKQRLEAIAKLAKENNKNK